MNAKLLLLGGAIAIAIVLVLLRASDDGTPSAPAAVETATPESAIEPIAAPIDSAPDAGRAERSSVATEPATDTRPETAPAPAAAPLDGLAFDASGVRLADARVRATDGEQVVTTGADGRFRFPERPRGAIEIAEPDRATVLWGSTAVKTRESVVVSARAIDLRGRVVDESGLPIPGARLSFALPHGFRGRFPVVVDDSQDRSRAEDADADGAFAFAALPAVEGATLQVSHKAFRPTAVAVPSASDLALLVTLRRPDAEPVGVRGTVVDDAGAPVAGAFVGWGGRCTESAADGTFAFPADRAPAEAGDPPEEGAIRPAEARTSAEEAELTMVAVIRGRLPGSLRATSVDGYGRALWPEPLVLRLGGAPLAIRGRVEDPEGRPRAGVRVWANALTFFGWRPDPGSGDRELTYLEVEVGGRAPGWNPERTDEHGEFVLEGLLPRSYHLTAMGDGSVARVDRLDVPAGSSGVVLRFSPEALIPAVKGRVVDRTGAGIPGVQVCAKTDTYCQDVHGVRTGYWSDSGPVIATDAEGRFTLTDVPRERAYLGFSGENVISKSLRPEETRWPPGEEEIVVTLALRCHFRVEIEDPTLAGSIALLDRNGEQLSLTEYQGGGSYSAGTMGLREGRSSTLVASDEARTLLLLKDGNEVARVPIELATGRITVLRP